MHCMHGHGLRNRDWHIKEQFWRLQGRHISLYGSSHRRGHILLPCPLSLSLAKWEEEEKKGRDKGMQADYVQERGVMDGRISSSLLCMLLRMLTCFYWQSVERDALMDERHPLPFQQCQCLMHPGLRDWPYHSLPSRWLMDLPWQTHQGSRMGLGLERGVII